MSRHSPDDRPIQELPLEALNRDQWEQLCDGCGLCCLIRLEDNKGGFVFTNVACRLLDLNSCRCSDYSRRKIKVPQCIQLFPPDADKVALMPPSCAYRLRFEGKPLPPWHHLICGDRQEIHRSGHTPLGKVVSEEHIHPRQLHQHIVDWFDEE